jgi:CDGSH-type Zn-finger protein
VVTGRNVPDRDERRVTVVPNGPMLVEGPVELVTEDGVTHTSDRFVVAVCACRRSKRYPFCDTSHRRRVRSEDSPDSHDDSR